MDETILNKFNHNNPPNFNMLRKKEIQQKYDDSIGTFKQKLFISYIEEKINRESFVFVDNTYPYDLAEGIKHSCLWYRGNFAPFDVYLYLKSKNIKYITFFENDVKFKSIKSISHYHIFHY